MGNQNRKREKNVAKWTDESKPIIESANLDGDFFRINANITLRDTNVMGAYELQDIVEHLRCIVRAFDNSEKYLKSGCRVLNIDEFMELPDNEKVNYINRIYPEGKPGGHQDYDIEIFPVGYMGVAECEMCSKPQERFIGTSDPREPKFCFKHYKRINKDSEFIPGAVA